MNVAQQQDPEIRRIAWPKGRLDRRLGHLETSLEQPTVSVPDAEQVGIDVPRSEAVHVPLRPLERPPVRVQPAALLAGRAPRSPKLPTPQSPWRCGLGRAVEMQLSFRPSHQKTVVTDTSQTQTTERHTNAPSIGSAYRNTSTSAPTGKSSSRGGKGIAVSNQRGDQAT